MPAVDFEYFAGVVLLCTAFAAAAFVFLLLLAALDD